MPGKGRHDNVMLRFSVGGKNLGKVKNKTGKWLAFIRKLSVPTRTAELFRDYLRLSTNDQKPLKEVNGFWIGAHCDGGKRARDTIHERDSITFDIDDAPACLLDELELGFSGISGFEFAVHSTRKHSKEKPRLRIVFPLSRPVTADQYNAAARLLAYRLDPSMDLVDDVSFRLAQMMYWPTCSKDSDFFFLRNEGELVDPIKLLEEFGDWQDDTKLPYSEKQGRIRKAAKKAQVPTEKKGLIGAFCRAYSIEDAIETFLSDVYLPGDPHSGKPRYTYAHGSGSNGAVVEDGGLFLYSHHGTDPCGDRLVNAWDMVRLHRFRHLDELPEEDDSITPAKRESYLAMAEFAQADDRVKGELLAERYDFESMFHDSDTRVAPADLTDDDLLGFGTDSTSTGARFDPDIEDLIGPPAGVAAPATRQYVAPADWYKRLDVTQTGEIKTTLPNVMMILESDPRTRGAIRYDLFNHRVCLRRTVDPEIELVAPAVVPAWRLDGVPWADQFELTLRGILEWPPGKKKKGYGLSGTKQLVTDAAAAIAARNPFHPVREFFDSLVWDGKPRMDRLLVDYLGVEDDEYHREVAQRLLLGAVARVYRPGHKFDFAVILEGPQGIRKSTFIEILAMRRWYGELTDDVSNQNRMVEKMAGKLIMEIGELAALNRSEINDIKAFISRTEDTVRLAYARNSQTYPRQCIFIGSTNQGEYLKDDTGGRRFWPVQILVDMIDTARLEQEMPQIWAEAVHVHRQRRAGLDERAELNLDFKDPRAREVAAELQEEVKVTTEVDSYVGMIEAWLNKPVRLSQLFEDSERAFDLKEDPLVLRTVTCAKIIHDAVLADEHIPFERAARKINDALAKIKMWQRGRKASQKGRARVRGLGEGGRYYFGGSIGQQRAYVRIDATPRDVMRGYVVAKDDESNLI